MIPTSPHSQTHTHPFHQLTHEGHTGLLSSSFAGMRHAHFLHAAVAQWVAYPDTVAARFTAERVGGLIE